MKTGLGADARLYDLRHTFASVGAGGGLSPCRSSAACLATRSRAPPHDTHTWPTTRCARRRRRSPPSLPARGRQVRRSAASVREEVPNGAVAQRREGPRGPLQDLGSVRGQFPLAQRSFADGRDGRAIYDALCAERHLKRWRSRPTCSKERSSKGACGLERCHGKNVWR